jgi:hypothetical protein
MHHGQVALGDGPFDLDNRLLHTSERRDEVAHGGGAVGEERIVLDVILGEARVDDAGVAPVPEAVEGISGQGSPVGGVRHGSLLLVGRGAGRAPGVRPSHGPVKAG